MGADGFSWWESPMRRRLLVLAVFAVTGLAGCNRFTGPLETRQLGRADAPGYTIEEQKKRGRERLAITEDDYRIGPKGYIDRPSPTGR
jgi:hypothetical protein